MTRLAKWAGSHSCPLFICLALLLSLAAIWAYLPGLRGPFLFDDFATLPALGAWGGVRDWSSAVQFVASNATGPGGRPLTLLSFLANAHDWPTASAPFKITNLALHLITGGLLFGITRRMVKGDSRRGFYLASLVAGFWLLNPFNVSTTLYVVQRMAILSALFSIAGLYLYLRGRLLFPVRARAGYVWMTAGLLLFTPLAFLGKENGALLPLLVVVTEYTVIRHHLKLPPPHTAWTLAFLVVPGLGLIAAMLPFAGPEAYAVRGYDLAQRLLTESRVLFDYVYHWFNTFAITRGVLAEDYPVSASLWSPWTTLPSVLGVCGLSAWAVLKRGDHPLAAMAILFFLAGHLLESSILPLEIYFEHRNYLPAMFLALPVAAWVLDNSQRWRLLPVLALAMLITQAAFTHRLAGVWGNELRLAAWWARHNPDSSRAQDFHAAALSNRGRPDLAAAVMDSAIARNPANSHFHLHLTMDKCAAWQLTRADLESLLIQLTRHPLHPRSYPLLTRLVSQAPRAACAELNASAVLEILDSLLADPDSRQDSLRAGQLWHLRGEILLQLSQAEAARSAFESSLNARPDIGIGMQQVALLAENQHFEMALNWLARVEKLPRPTGWRERAASLDYDIEIQRIRGLLQSDLANQPNTATRTQ